MLKTGKQIKRNVVSLITNSERGESFVQLLAVLISLVSFNTFFPTVSSGAELEIRQEIYHYQVPFAEVIPVDTFIIYTASKQTPVKTSIPPVATLDIPSPSPVFSNSIIVHFKFDSANISPAERTRLLSLLHEYEVPQTNPLKVTGFTCKTGPAEFNLWLSEERAKSVSNLLEEKGYTVSQTQGKGATEFISKLNGPNRRVEIAPFKIIPAHTGQHQISTQEETP